MYTWSTLIMVLKCCMLPTDTCNQLHSNTSAHICGHTLFLFLSPASDCTVQLIQAFASRGSVTPKARSPRVNLRVVPFQMSLLFQQVQTGPIDEITSSTLTGPFTRGQRCRRMDSKSRSRRTTATRITGATSMTWTQAEP